MQAKNVLIVCSERSGSNLLKAILNRHSQIYVGPPIPLYECFTPIIQSYGDLEIDENWHELLNDATELISFNHQPLPCTISTDQLKERVAAKARNWATLIEGVYSLIAEAEGCAVYGYKYSTNMQNLAPFLAAIRFTHVIYQVRDPRDVIMSEIKSGFVDETVDSIARRWSSAQADARSAIDSNDCNVLEQTYEDLVSSPERVLARIWSFLGVEPCDDALEFYGDKINISAANKTHVWANLAQPLIRRNYSKFYKEWNYRDIAQVEDIIGEELQIAGYKRANRFLFRSRKRAPAPQALTESDWGYVRPQLQKWQEIREKAEARSRT